MNCVPRARSRSRFSFIIHRLNRASSSSYVSYSKGRFVQATRSFASVDDPRRLVAWPRLTSALTQTSSKDGPCWQCTHDHVLRSAARPMSSIPQCGYPIGVLKRRLLFQNSREMAPWSRPTCPCPAKPCHCFPLTSTHPGPTSILALTPTHAAVSSSYKYRPVSSRHTRFFFRNVYYRRPRRIQRAYARQRPRD
jgi:hypothetical protein